MNSTLSRAILALLIGISFPIFTSTQVVSAAPVAGVLGDSCVTPYMAGVIAADSTLTTEIAGVCFPSLNIPQVYIWSKDNNQTAAYTVVAGKIAFGRECPSTVDKPCSIPDPITAQYLIDEPFVRDYPDTEYDPKLYGDRKFGIWWSKTYFSNIVAANYVAPEAIAATAEPMQVGGPTSSQAVSSTLLIGLAAAVSLTSAAGSSSNQPSPNRPESPDAPELLRARKERRFATTNKVGRFFQGSVISMDRWAFFTAKLPALIRKVGKRSSVAATSIGDADYLRAVLGIFTLLFYPAAILIGVLEFNSLTKETLPIPGTTWLIAALVIGCFDSLAGAISALTFILLTVICNLTNTNINWLTFIGTLVFIFILSTGPALFAGALRRFDGVHTNRKGRWERLVDYALSPIVTAWVVWKGLELLPKISEKKEVQNWADNINKIAVIVFICIFIRYFIEGFVAKHFAERINEIVTESIPMQSQSKINLHIRKAFWISLIASLLLVPETVSDKIMLLVFLSLLLPAVTLSFGIKPTDSIAKFNIIGTPRLVFLLCTGLALNSIFTSKGVDSNLGLFIVLAFGPILYCNLMEALTESHLKSPAYFYQTRIGRFLYRAGSVLLYIFIISVIYTQVGWKP
jgi:uncharacterized membrane protein